MNQVEARINTELQGARIPFEEIPVVDLGPLMRNERRRERAVAREIGKICENIGFFYVANHGVSAALVDDMMAHARRFFALPLTAKTKVHNSKSMPRIYPRGYFPIEAEALARAVPRLRPEPGPPRTLF